MPYRSKAQMRFAHTDAAKRKGFPTKEFDKASKGAKDTDEDDKKGKFRFGGKQAAPFGKGRKKRPVKYPKPG